MWPEIKIEVTGPVHIHGHDDQQLRRLEWLMRKVLEATVTDPAKFAEIAAKIEADTARMEKAVKTTAA